MRQKRGRVYHAPRKKEATPEQLEQLRQIVLEQSGNLAWANLRAVIERACESEGIGLAEAHRLSREEPESVIAGVVGAYFGLVGVAEEDALTALDDLIRQLIEFEKKAKAFHVKLYDLIGVLLKNGAHWANVNSPSNIGALIFPKWFEIPEHVREQRLANLQRARDKFNFARKDRSQE